MARSTVHYADSETNNILKRLHNKLRPAGTPVQRVEYIIELLLLRIFEVKLKHDESFTPLRKLFAGENYHLLFSHLLSLTGDQVKEHLNKHIFPFYSRLLSHARNIFTGNLPQKVQDQLVLIEEVFANSSFTTNVQSGNMGEIVGLVNEIDEKRILKTDLLGDAIESALAETGGTQDIGLHRTPDHIRQMMVALVDPDFTDTIFDPACGTGGFLFDAYQYVLERTTKDEKWPGERAHPELQEYFKKYFTSFNPKMPTSDVANHFYRSGIGGIEYLGMIRKMAAINLYIRGLNPQNIQQGDSLRIFDPATDANTKSVVIANPPFGAERDQPAYPNVWEDYSRESETTILFVKLMFDLLQPGGRCAVVVSEGFLTWGQKSACALRKKLLEEASLKAIISLPQGVFVSKSGQGAKTSILYFEKGEPTKQIWYYKIENDGFSMGVNRKPIEGCQIPEVIELFTEYIKQDKTPPESNHSFMIAAKWLKTLDPRVKERIKTETEKEFAAKIRERRQKLIEQINERRAKGKLSKQDYEEKLWQFDNVWENKTQNEIAKRIEKEYSCSYNLQNYRSNLREEQTEAWTKELKQVSPIDNLSIDDKYQKLPKADAKTALSIFASFDPHNALEMDVVREYLSKAKEKNEKLERLEEILKKGLQYPIMPLKDMIICHKRKIKPKEHPQTEFVVLGVSNQDGVFVNERKLGEEIKQVYYRVEKNQFCYNPYRVNVGSIGLNEFNYKEQIISGAYIVFGVDESKVLPKYLLAIFNSQKFLDYVNEMASGGVRMNFKFDYLQDWQIPLPQLEIQKETVAELDRYQNIINGAKQVIANYKPTITIDPGWEIVRLEDASDRVTKGTTPTTNGFKFQESGINFIKIESIDDGGYFIKEKFAHIDQKCNESLKRSQLKENDVLFSIAGALGRVALVDSSILPANTNQALAIISPKKELDSKYLEQTLRSDLIQNQIYGLKVGVAQSNLSLAQVSNFEIPLPPFEVQKQIVAQIEAEQKLVNANKELINIYEQKIKDKVTEILKGV